MGIVSRALGPLDEIVEISVLAQVLRSREIVDGASDLISYLGRAIRDGIVDLGYQRFSRFWIPMRLTVGLQLRLFVETVLFSMGKPWSELVSGFKPLRWPMDQGRPPTISEEKSLNVIQLIREHLSSVGL